MLNHNLTGLKGRSEENRDKVTTRKNTNVISLNETDHLQLYQPFHSLQGQSTLKAEKISVSLNAKSSDILLRLYPGQSFLINFQLEESL